MRRFAQWLSYLGVHAQVTYLAPRSDQIQVSLSVGKPESCDTNDWQQILKNLTQSDQAAQPIGTCYIEMTPSQQSKLQRLLAYLLQVGSPDQSVNWDIIYPQLQRLNLDESLLLGIKSALKVPQSLDQVTKELDPDVAAIALPQAVSIAWLDRQVNQEEDTTLSILLDAMK